MMQSTNLSPRAEQTRDHIYETAMALFQEYGYDQTTMRMIAKSADVSIGLTYRYFARKEDIIMALYADCVIELIDYMEALPTGQLADRYHRVLEHSLNQLLPHRLPLMALFGSAMQSDSSMSLMDTNPNSLSQRLVEGYHQLVLGSEDALREPKSMQLGIALYTFHMLIILFWLYDRTPNQQATHKLRHFVYELFKTLRPMFILPMVPQAIAKLAGIIMPPIDDSEPIGVQNVD